MDACRATILVVDDEEGNLLAMKKVLEQEAYQVVTARQAAMALSLCAGVLCNLNRIHCRSRNPNEQRCDYSIYGREHTSRVSFAVRFLGATSSCFFVYRTGPRCGAVLFHGGVGNYSKASVGRGCCTRRVRRSVYK